MQIGKSLFDEAVEPWDKHHFGLPILATVIICRRDRKLCQTLWRRPELRRTGLQTCSNWLNRFTWCGSTSDEAILHGTDSGKGEGCAGLRRLQDELVKKNLAQCFSLNRSARASAVFFPDSMHSGRIFH